MPKLLRQIKAAEYLGVGRDTFKKLDLPCKLVNGQKMWSVDFLDRWANRQDNICNSTNVKTRHTGAMPSQSEELGFEEALERTSRQRLLNSRQSTITR